MKLNQSQFDAYQQEDPVRPSSSTNVFSYQAHPAPKNQNVKSNSMIPYSNNFPYEFTFDNGKITRNNRSPFDQNNQLNSAQKQFSSLNTHSNNFYTGMVENSFDQEEEEVENT